MYRITVTATGYNTWSELRYIPPSNTDTVVVEMTETGGGASPDLSITSNCQGTLKDAQDCTFRVNGTTVFDDMDFVYTWNGSSYEYNKTSDNDGFITLSATNETLPITVNVYLNGVLQKTFTVTWDSQTATISIEFDDDIVKADDTFLMIFYLIITFVGIGIWLIINTFAKGWGVLGLGAWYLLWAVQGFEVLFVPISMIFGYYGFKSIWGGE